MKIIWTKQKLFRNENISECFRGTKFWHSVAEDEAPDFENAEVDFDHAQSLEKFFIKTQISKQFDHFVKINLKKTLNFNMPHIFH